jgi:hypothetical protein
MAAERSSERNPGPRLFAGAQPGSAAPSPAAASSRRINRLKDEVYREMLLLESNRPGSEMGLALTLLRAVVRRDSLPMDPQFQQWLSEVCSLGLKMIEASLDAGGSCASAE